MPSARRLVGPFLALGIILAACTPTPTTTPRPSSTSSAATPVGSVAPSNATSPMAEDNVLRVATDATLGDYLTDVEGMTLYVFMKDGVDKSVCNEACASTWPPYVVAAGEAVMAGEGVSGTIATFARADGTTQVSYNGQPLYYYSSDTAAGDTNGQGVGGNWFVAPATGKASPAPATGSAEY